MVFGVIQYGCIKKGFGTAETPAIVRLIGGMVKMIHDAITKTKMLELVMHRIHQLQGNMLYCRYEYERTAIHNQWIGLLMCASDLGVIGRGALPQFISQAKSWHDNAEARGASRDAIQCDYSPCMAYAV